MSKRLIHWRTATGTLCGTVSLSAKEWQTLTTNSRFRVTCPHCQMLLPKEPKP